MENVKVHTISDLIQRRLSLTGTSNFHQSSSFNSLPPELLQSNPRPVPSTSSSPAESNPHPKVLTSLKYPTILIGTLTLPFDAPGSSILKPSCSCPTNNCFQFTDGSETVCCDILDIDIRMFGKEIRVLSWNFIPLRSAGGFLEIIKWEFLSPSWVLRQCSDVDPVLLDIGTFSTSTDKLKVRHCVCGLLQSVGPVTIVPCTLGQRNLQTNGESDSSAASKNLRGFMVHIMICECRSCTSKEPMSLPDNSVRELNTHSFVKPTIVYLCGSASSWHPVLSKFVGLGFITFWGLKKKLVSIGKAKSCLMYVSSEKSSLHLSRLSRIRLPCKKSVIKGKGECGSYTGIIKGVYMQGMLVELENEVWVLLTDHFLSPPHSIRVGAIISVRNAHFVNPRFPWSKLLLLGTCVKTSIFVQLFSPLETKCLVLSQSRSMLGKFISTLPFSTRLWVLLLISSFRKMFAGDLSEKEILGSKHNEGLVQMYAKLHLPMSMHRYQHGPMMKLYEHDSCCCASEPCNFNLETVVPVSVLISYCNSTRIRKISLKNEKVVQYEYSQLDHFRLLPPGGRSSHHTTRKIYHSEDIGFVLVGSLKISTYSGRLQLVDATGGIDVIVPDLPSTWNLNGIYEVSKYIMVIEGIPQMEKYLINQSFSCRRFFQSISTERDLSTTIYVYFQYRNATCKKLPSYSCDDNASDLVIFESGTYDLLEVTHKFPISQKFQGQHLAPNTSSMFVEALLHPWNLFLTEGDKKYSTKASLKQQREDAGAANNQKYVNKRLKTDDPSGRVEGSDIACDFDQSSCGFNGCCASYRVPDEEQKCCNLSLLRISCVATIKSSDHCSQYIGFLQNTRSKPDSGGGSGLSTQKILLEIQPENFSKYQFLRIGSYYITKRNNDRSLFNMEGSNCINSQKILINSCAQLWCISFTFGNDILHSTEYDNTQFSDFPVCDGGVISGDQIDLHCGSLSDVYLHLPANAKDSLVFVLEKQEENSTKLVLKPEETGKPCYRDVISSDMQTSVLHGTDCLFPEGKLSSVKGHVVAVHDLHQSCIDSNFKCQSIKGGLCRFPVGGKSICIHLLMEDQIVKIFGYLKNHALPVGFGPGVSATFHRVLELGDPRRLMLTPVSFIDISSFRVLDHSFTEKYPDSVSYSDTISLQLFSQLINSSHCKLTKFRCRVVAVNFLVLEKNIDHVNLQVEISPRQPLVKIPLAGFMLDDGSSRCNCWASGERAAALLRLHDPLPQLAFKNIDRAFEWTGMTHYSPGTASYHLGKVLKNHGRIIMRSCGSLLNSYQDLDISLASDNALSRANESFIKFILVNSCISAIWTLIGSKLDSDAVRNLLKEHTMEPWLMESHNIWVTDVYRTNALKEARNAILELANG
ncbi:CST complex subunit CTC1 [Cucumis melo var. makuwa]|uniref:CST complex subunit CTC1 n=1 Tax=Cucumis melo var. makuwa TaxID=1194695 RepID=A0A5D3D9S0_CUCMM|nr:CST complex subunit CTC1 [Cucumis melo var. makuwa]TYK20230.1 CST complex subunit CTC1 [Cucumis melo var. makuwa]